MNHSFAGNRDSVRVSRAHLPATSSRPGGHRPPYPQLVQKRGAAAPLASSVHFELSLEDVLGSFFDQAPLFAATGIVPKAFAAQRHPHQLDRLQRCQEV